MTAMPQKLDDLVGMIENKSNVQLFVSNPLL